MFPQNIPNINTNFASKINSKIYNLKSVSNQSQQR